MTAELDLLVAGWVRVYGVRTAYAVGDEGRDALAHAGVDVAAPNGGAAGKRDLVLTGLAPADELARLAALAAKVVVVIGPNTRRAFAEARIDTVGPLVWGIGRVKERFAFDAPPALEGLVGLAPARLRSRLCRREAFLVDVSPRTPQARRKLLRTVP